MLTIIPKEVQLLQGIYLEGSSFLLFSIIFRFFVSKFASDSIFSYF